MIKVLTVIGTRPEAIKLAPVLTELARRSTEFESRVVVTGQHKEMLEQMLALFEIEPHHDLAVMEPGQSASEVTSKVLDGLAPILSAERPDWIIVQGDTTTAMAASLAAFYEKVPVAHVEAGLRTFDKYSPFPEEVNRRMTGVIADIHFAPTSWAATNLLRESVPSERIMITGNTCIDALDETAKLPFDKAASQVADVPDDARVVLVTAHRSENFGRPVAQIAAAISRLSYRNPDLHFVFPMHLNPKVRGPVLRELAGIDNVTLTNPLEYPEMVWMIDRADVVVTDSGGLQEEAAGSGTPVLVMRDSTERPEGVDAGLAKLVGTDRDRLVREVERLVRDRGKHREMTSNESPYGDGNAAHRIVETLAGRKVEPTTGVYETPEPEHPFDKLLHAATAEIPREYADKVIARGRRVRRAQPLESGETSRTR